MHLPIPGVACYRIQPVQVDAEKEVADKGPIEIRADAKIIEIVLGRRGHE